MRIDHFRVGNAAGTDGTGAPLYERRVDRVVLLLCVGIALLGFGLVCIAVGRDAPWNRTPSDFTPNWPWIGRLLIYASVVVPVLLYALEFTVDIE